MKAKWYVVGFFTGVSIAAAFSLLSTPTSGKELRQSIKGKANDSKKVVLNFKEDSKQLVDQLKETTSLTQDSVKDLSSDLMESAWQWKNEVSPHVSQLKSDLKNFKNNLDQLKDRS
ncbi:YtxH domain-containing protein [Alkalihalobacillus sp. 1P02AB]|uniref:YtxH domain-containing protein n=1 Tax=Alkalihalobacillus sp. 1P02AB TaxID=3132260 RepID=UPI0039A6E6A0